MTASTLTLVPEGLTALANALNSSPLGVIPGLMGRNAKANLEEIGQPSGSIECIADFSSPKLIYVSAQGKTSEITRMSPDQKKELGKLYNELKELIQKDATDFSIDLDHLIATIDGNDVVLEITPELDKKIQEFRTLVGKIYKNEDLRFPIYEPGQRTTRHAPHSFAHNEKAFKKEAFPESDLNIMKSDLPPIERKKRYKLAEEIRQFLISNVTDKLVPKDKALEGQSRRTSIAKTQELLQSVDNWAALYAVTNPLSIPSETSVDDRTKMLTCYMETAKGFLEKNGSMNDAEKKSYLEDLVRLHCSSRAEYRCASEILGAPHRQDGPELFLVRLTECIASGEDPSSLIDSPLSLLVLGPLNEVDRQSVRELLKGNKWA